MAQLTTIPHTRSTPEGTVFDPDATADLTPDLDALAIEQQQRALLVRVFSFVALGLMTSAAVALLALKNTDIYESALRHSLGYQVMFGLEVISVSFIYKYVQSLNIAMVWVTFLFYSAFNGISFALFFLWLPPTSVALAFFLTAITFGAMALYGRNTQTDLGSFKSLGILVGIGIGLMILVNLIFRNGEAFYATSFLGIMFFAGLTASHVQDIRNMEWEFEDDDPARDKAALVSALLIYLDLVNLYMMFMRVAAQSRNVRAAR